MTTNTEQRHDEEAETSLHADLRSLRQRAEHAEAHWKRLDRELPLMRKQNQRLMAFLQDALAFTRTSDMKPNLILSTLIHDFDGLVKDEPCFLPRVTGYAAKITGKEL